MTLSADPIPHAVVEPKLLGPHSHDDLLAAYVDVNGDYEAFRAKLNLTGAQLLIFIEDKAITQRRVVIDAFLSLDKARRNQDHTAQNLKSTMNASTNLVECRRTATALANLVRHWDCFDPASPTAPTKRSAPAPKQPPASSKTAPPPPPPKPLITLTPRLSEHAGQAVGLPIDLFRSPRLCGTLGTAERLAVQLAKGATLDHKPIPPQAYLDPAVLAEFVKDSTLSDLKDDGPAHFIPLSLTSTDVAMRLIRTDKPDQVLVDVTATRKDISSPWLITSISSPHRTPPDGTPLPERCIPSP